MSVKLDDPVGKYVFWTIIWTFIEINPHWVTPLFWYFLPIRRAIEAQRRRVLCKMYKCIGFHKTILIDCEKILMEQTFCREKNNFPIYILCPNDNGDLFLRN